MVALMVVLMVASTFSFFFFFFCIFLFPKKSGRGNMLICFFNEVMLVL